MANVKEVLKKLNQFFKVWGEENEYDWNGTKFSKIESLKNSDSTDIPSKEEKLNELLTEKLKKENYNGLLIELISGEIKYVHPDNKDSKNLEIISRSDLEQINRKNVQYKRQYLEEKKRADKLGKLSSENLFNELFNQIKANEEIYSLLKEIINNEEKLNTIIPALLNIEYLLEVKAQGKENNVANDVFDSNREKEIAQAISWYLLKCDENGSLKHSKIIDLINYLNNEVLESFEIILDDYNDSKILFNKKHMVSLGQEDSRRVLPYRFLTLPIKVKKTGGAHKIKKALVINK